MFWTDTTAGQKTDHSTIRYLKCDLVLLLVYIAFNLAHNNQQGAEHKTIPICLFIYLIMTAIFTGSDLVQSCARQYSIYVLYRSFTSVYKLSTTFKCFLFNSSNYKLWNKTIKVHDKIHCQKVNFSSHYL